MKYQISTSLMLLAAALSIGQSAFAQGRGRGGGGAPANPKAGAPIDLTGYWVSVVTEDWRYRMVTPAPGDYQGVPMSPAAVKIADAWDPAKDEASGDQCKSYGAPALYRIPGRLHITWEDDQTLKIEADAGKQMRVVHFGGAAGGGAKSLQGDSFGSWEAQREGGKAVTGDLKVSVTNLKGGYLRKNGVPYSDSTTITEYYDLVKERNGDQLMVITQVINDPTYLRQPFMISTHFKKQASDAGWKPSECSSRW
jgi:hypothetical protein